NLLANLIGKPGKTGIDGSQVQAMYDSGRVEEVNDYCRCDVLDTYFVFLRSRVLAGFLSINAEQEIVTEAYRYLEQEAKSNKAYQHYLEHWGDWEPPSE
ncbi:MAG TPA: 3'-5' exonuclease, partial [Planctomycetaceae bacterium]|nr:3'-5' exonuclease [Planctomycetaceae bacterium]